MSNKKKKKGISGAQFMAFGFLLVILAGTFLLMLPISSKDGQITSFLDSLFTAVSSTCVTGLVTVDTYTHWTLFGQIVILVLIQVGGLGIVTISAFLYLILRQKIGLNMRSMIQQSTLSLDLTGVVKLLKKILFRTLMFEAIGAILLSTQFIPLLGPARGIYYGVFHSISAFCNAGFDLMGRYDPYSSLTMFAGNPVVNFTIMGLILVGGLGFVVWEEVSNNGFKVKKYSLHAKVVFLVSFILVIVGTFLFYIFEKNNLLANMPTGQAVMNAMFSSVTPRTAGFNTIDLDGLTPASKLLTTIFMFIGGNPGSTAGGIKTTTVIVMAAYIWSCLVRSPGAHILKRRIGDENIKQASMVFGLNLSMSIIALLIISALQSLSMSNLILEVFSAMGTVGLSTGITRELIPLSKVILMLLMFAGRIGTVTFALSFRGRKKTALVDYPVEQINVG